MNKKFLIIGDIHGRDDWREIVNGALPSFMPIIFLGDYVDSFDISAAEQKYNLKEIIALKEKYPDRIKLLIGNHDWAYIYDQPRISGFQHNHWYDIKEIFKNKLDLFDVAYGYTNLKTRKYTLFTHAGLTYEFYKRNILPRINGEMGEEYQLKRVDNNTDLHVILNKLKGNVILWAVGPMRGGSGNPGPLWADYLELIEDAYPDINQVVGHTASGTVNTYQNGEDLIVKVDGWYNKKLAHITLEL